MSDVMLDLETMGNGPCAAIIPIGAVEFDIETGLIGRRFYKQVDLASSVEAGGIIDASTVMWWMQQSEAARGAFSGKGCSNAQALCDFSFWAESCADGDLKMWGNGAAFDNVILSSAYRRNKTEQPWKFWNDRCYRTVRAQHPNVEMVRVGTYHNAVDDAESQASHLIRMLNDK